MTACLTLETFQMINVACDVKQNEKIVVVGEAMSERAFRNTYLWLSWPFRMREFAYCTRNRSQLFRTFWFFQEGGAKRKKENRQIVIHLIYDQCTTIRLVLLLLEDIKIRFALIKEGGQTCGDQISDPIIGLNQGVQRPLPWGILQYLCEDFLWFHPQWHLWVREREGEGEREGLYVRLVGKFFN